MARACGRGVCLRQKSQGLKRAVAYGFPARAAGYLALLDAGGKVAYEFAPKYPEQFDDVSFGKGNTKRNEVILLREKSAARALVPKTSTAGKGWKELDFDDSSWKKGKTAVGYDYGSRIGLNVSEMRNSTESVYIRVPFTVTDLSQIEEVVLRLKYEDGFTAFINGKKIASDNAPSSLNWKSGAPQNRPDSIATTPGGIRHRRICRHPGPGITS